MYEFQRKDKPSIKETMTAEGLWTNHLIKKLWPEMWAYNGILDKERDYKTVLCYIVLQFYVHRIGEKDGGRLMDKPSYKETMAGDVILDKEI